MNQQIMEEGKVLCPKHNYLLAFCSECVDTARESGRQEQVKQDTVNFSVPEMEKIRKVGYEEGRQEGLNEKLLLLYKHQEFQDELNLIRQEERQKFLQMIEDELVTDKEGNILDVESNQALEALKFKLVD